MPLDQTTQPQSTTSSGTSGTHTDATTTGPSGQALGASGDAAVHRMALDAPALTADRARAAFQANQARHLPAQAWAQVAAVTGCPDPTLSTNLTQAIAAWQAGSAQRDAHAPLPVTGVCDDVTLQWMSDAPGGAGLEDAVQRETTMYMGLNEDSYVAERATLHRAIGADLVDATGDLQHQGHALVHGAWLDLNDDAQRAQALASLPGLPQDFSARLDAFLKNLDANIRDEIFNMMRYLWTVETGRGLLKRVVLSGHSTGETLWGGESMEFGSISYELLLQMFALFPHACSQVEDLAFSACYSLKHDEVQRYITVFPHLKTIWGYAAWSPSAGTGSTRHLADWEKGTRGHQSTGIDPARLEVARGHGTRDQNVAIWSTTAGYQTNVSDEKETYANLLGFVADDQYIFDNAMKQGEMDLTSLNQLYAWLQTLVHDHAAELGPDLAKYHTMLMQTLYLREWNAILDEFDRRFGAVAAAAYAEAGASAPTWKGKSRADVLKLVASFTPAGPKGQAAVQAMKRVLVDLDPTQIEYGGGQPSPPAVAGG